MFGKRLKGELAWYVRCLWPFAVGLAVAAAIAGIIVAFDRNPVEATGTVAFIGLFVLAAVAFFIVTIVFGILSFRREFSAKHEEAPSPEESRTGIFGAKFLAYVLCMLITGILIFAGTLPFIWKLLSNFTIEWQYCLEAVVFIAIIVPLLYLVPTALSLAFRIRLKRNVFRISTIILGILILVLLVPLTVFEVLLLIHSESTDMHGLWITVIAMLALAALADACAYALICRYLKKKGELTV